jgi:aspartyl/asparaginyl-tRNA synthetase
MRSNEPSHTVHRAHRRHAHRPRGQRLPVIRLAATLEFLRAIDFEFPAWAEEYMTAAETTLGDAYSEPAADVRGYVAQMKSQVA